MSQVDGKSELADGRLKEQTGAVRVRSGQNTVGYWRERLFRNSYTQKGTGLKVEIPEYYVRMRWAGVTKKVRLGFSEKEKAAEHALRLWLRMEAEGWSAVAERQARLPASPTIEEFGDIYAEAITTTEKPPRPVSISIYVRCLKQLCSLAGVNRVRELDRAAVEAARQAYRKKARGEGRKEPSVSNTFSKIVRNAAGCFSREAIAAMRARGLEMQNPFTGIRRTQEIDPVVSLPESVLERIRADLPLLKDGNNTWKPTEKKKAGKAAKPTWNVKVDWRDPQPEAYAAIVLALGAGLRANEIDKARWSWFRFNQRKECFLEIRAEDDFKPKGTTGRTIKIPAEVHSMLEAARRDVGSKYVLGGVEAEKATNDRSGYRRPNVLRIASAWLRQRGVEADKPRGTPLHRLRKQFGSEVASTFGLFAAQKLLGHTSPDVTSRYYAAQTNHPDLTHLRLLGA